MKKNDMIKYGIFVIGLVVIFLSAILYGRTLDFKGRNVLEEAQLRGNFGQAVWLILLGWIGVFFGLTNLYKILKSRKR